MGTKEAITGNDLKSRIAGLSAEKRALLEQKLMEKRARVPEDQEIPRRRPDDVTVPSFCQQRLWFLDQLAPGTSTYNVPNLWKIEGTLDAAALRKSFETFIQRHEVLRTRFACEYGMPVPITPAEWSFEFPIVDLRHLPEAERRPKAEALLAEVARQPFDLAQDIMLRTLLVQIADEEHDLLVSTHHVAWDAWSKIIMCREIAALYGETTTGIPGALPQLSIQYGDFALWQKNWLQGENLRQQADFWKKSLTGAPAKLEVATDKPRPPQQSLRGAKYPFTLPAELAERAKQLSRESSATIFMTLLAAFKIFLSAYTGEEDIVIGSPIAGRNRVQLESLIGFFINTMVMRTRLTGNPSYRQIIQRVKETTLGVYAHQDLPFEKLVEIMQPPRDLSRMTLFQVNFRVQTAPAPPLELPGLRTAALQLIDTFTSKFDLAMELSIVDGFGGYIEYSSDLYNESTIIAMRDDFEKLFTALLDHVDTPIQDLEIVQEIRRRKTRMAEPTAPAKSLKSLGGIKRKAVDLSAVSLVKSEVFAGHSSPLVFEPTAEVELAAWAQNNLPELDAKLREHGAILFRGFGLKDPTDFERVAAAIAGGLYGEYGDLPREGVADRVYTSTPYPEDKSILYHNESSHMARWPMKIFFFCVTAAKEGGATPIVDCREVYKSLDPKVRRLFEEKGLLYVRNFSEGLDVSWQHFFKTDDKSVVEKSCGAVGMDCEWRENNGLSIRQRCQAVAHHPVTGEPTFFNQVQLHHVYCLDSVVRESVMSIFKERDLPRHVYFGDGSTIEPAVMDHVGEIYEKHAVRFQWQAGDLIMLDNMITAHARDPFVGPRKIVVAMGQMMSADELSKTVAAKA